MPPETRIRFLDKIAVGDDCWEWTACRRSYGYGMFNVGSSVRGTSSRSAHRVSYQLFVGDIPDGFLICHHCDNPGCVKPSHLFAGTNADNLRDSARKGRMHPGEANGRATLTKPQVEDIRLDPRGLKELSKEYGVSRQTIWRVKKHMTYQEAA